jgi:hypothetical protein
VAVGVTVSVTVGVIVLVAVKVGVGVGASDTRILFEVPATDGFPFSTALIVLIPAVFKTAVKECTPASPGLKVNAGGSMAAGSFEEKITVPAKSETVIP